MRLGNWTRGVPAVLAAAGLAAAGCSGPKSKGLDACELPNRANLTCDDPDVVRALSLLQAMTVEEKVQQMSGPAERPNMFEQESNTKLGVPGLLYMDGPRGVRWWNSDFGTTVFPVAATRGSTWNPELERKIGKVMAQEMRALGRHILLAPTINQVSHPRWGRAQESYGEDAHLLGEMGAAFIRGAQYDPTVADPTDPDQPVEDTYRVLACAKHFAANNLEDQRVFVNAVLDERTLQEVYLPHFKKAVDAGVASVMSSYNRVNGSYAGYSKPLLRDILKTAWGFDGFVVSDWNAKGNTNASPAAGLDIEMPFSSGECPSMFDCERFYGERLVQAVKTGAVDEKLVDEAALRILHQKVKYGLLDHPVIWDPNATKSEGAQALALEAARQGIVLLKNGPTKALADDVLPLDPASLTKVAVVGMFANSENMGDKGSSDAKVMDGSLVITPFEGLRTAIGSTKVVTYPFIKDAFSGADNSANIQDADVLVVVTAYYFADLNRSAGGEEGEWKDRVSMSLNAKDLANVNNAIALRTANPNLKVVVVMKSGGAVVTSPWDGSVDAVLMAWFGGMKEGTALAEILLGDVNPSGKTCQSFPVAESDLPPFLNATQGDVAYDYYHGYRWLDRKGIAPRYPFGFGLSYTTFEYSNLAVQNPTIAADGTLTFRIDVKNTGAVAGSEVVQAYVGHPNTAVGGTWGRPVKELKAFARAENIAPGEARTVTLSLKASDLAYWNTTTRAMAVEKVQYQLLVGPSADSSDPNMKTATFTVQ
jgi:beta-glucosidase